MPLQNRVDPFGDIHAAPARGLFTGNRGIIHDPETRTLLRRRWNTKAWIICECTFRGRRREVMGRNAPSGRAGWTELFFLDEVTALAAGHRPCFFCRRSQAKAFACCLGQGLGIPTPKAGEIDARLHAERMAANGSGTVLAGEAAAAQPEGAMVAVGGRAFAVSRRGLLPWSFRGYGLAAAFDARERVRLITPSSTVAALRAGHSPVWHASAAEQPEHDKAAASTSHQRRPNRDWS